MAFLRGDYLQHRCHSRYYAKPQAQRGKIRDACTRPFGARDLLAMPPTQATLAETVAAALPMIGNPAALNASGRHAISVP